MITILATTAFTMFLTGTLCGFLLGTVFAAWPGHTVEKIDSEEV